MKNREAFRIPKVFIPAMQELILVYKEAIKKGVSKSDIDSSTHSNCLLCEPSNTHESRELYACDGFAGSCEKFGCPWIVMTGEICDSFIINDPDTCLIYRTTDSNIQKKRIKQLRYWIRVYKKEVEKHANLQR